MTNLIRREIPSIFPHNMFDSLFDMPDIFERVSTTLPYNVEAHKNKDGVVESTHLVFAVAGYKKEDIRIKVSGDNLLVSVEQPADKESESVVYQHKGISQKTVKLKFKLSGNADKEKISTTFSDGLLRIIIPIIPDEKELTIDIM